MKQLAIIPCVLLALGLTFDCRATDIKVPVLLEVPSFISGGLKAHLAKNRTSLTERLDALSMQEEAFNEKYAGRGFPAGDPRAREGVAAQARIEKSFRDYAYDAEAFNAIIRRQRSDPARVQAQIRAIQKALAGLNGSMKLDSSQRDEWEKNSNEASTEA